MTLYQLAQDKALMGELKQYFLTVLRERAIEQVFETGSAPHIKEAKEILDEAFENMEMQFIQKDQVKPQLNEAR